MVKSKITVVELNGFEKTTGDEESESIEKYDNQTNDNVEVVEQPKPIPKRKITRKKQQTEEDNIKPIEDNIKPIEDEKPKRKRQPKKQTTEEIKPADVEEIQPTDIEEVKTKPEKKIKTVELVKCEKCNKDMTVRTLRYTHPKMCVGKEINRDEVPVKRRSSKKASNDDIKNDIPEEIIINHIQKLKEKKKQEKEDKIKQLISKIV